MECPECHYKNPEGPACCGLCGLVLKSEETTSGSQDSAGRAPVVSTEAPFPETYRADSRPWWGRALPAGFLLLLGIFVLVQILNSRGGISWGVDFDQAAAEASRLHKTRMVYFSASWCRPCRSLERGAWKNEAIKELAGQLICVKIDVDKRKDLVNKFEVRGYPTVILLSPQGKVLYRMSGYGFGMDAELRNKIEDVLRIPSRQPSLE